MSALLLSVLPTAICRVPVAASEEAIAFTCQGRAQTEALPLVLSSSVSAELLSQSQDSLCLLKPFPELLEGVGSSPYWHSLWLWHSLARGRGLGLGLAVQWRLSWATAVPAPADTCVAQGKAVVPQVPAACCVPGRWVRALAAGELCQDMFPVLSWGCFCLVRDICFGGDEALTADQSWWAQEQPGWQSKTFKMLLFQLPAACALPGAALCFGFVAARSQELLAL